MASASPTARWPSAFTWRADGQAPPDARVREARRLEPGRADRGARPGFGAGRAARGEPRTKASRSRLRARRLAVMLRGDRSVLASNTSKAAEDADDKTNVRVRVAHIACGTCQHSVASSVFADVVDSSTVAIALRQPCFATRCEASSRTRGSSLPEPPPAPRRRWISRSPPAGRVAPRLRRQPVRLSPHAPEICTRAPSVRVLLYAGAGVIPPLRRPSSPARARRVRRRSRRASLRAIRSVLRGEYWVGRDSVVDVLRYARQLSTGGQRQGHANGHSNGHARPAETLTAREIQIIRGIARGSRTASWLGASPQRSHGQVLRDRGLRQARRLEPR